MSCEGLQSNTVIRMFCNYASTRIGTYRVDDNDDYFAILWSLSMRPTGMSLQRSFCAMWGQMGPDNVLAMAVHSLVYFNANL